MSASVAPILRYLRECYRENGSRGGIWDFLGTSITHRLFLEESDWLASRPDSNDGFYLRQAEASETAKQAALYRKEKDLIYASLFLLGTFDRSDGRPEPVCAPLFWYSATLESDGLEHGATLKVNPSSRQINAPILEAAGGEGFARLLEESIEPGALSEGCVGQVRTLLKQAIPESDTDALLQYPRLIGERELRREMRQFRQDPSRPPQLVPAAAVALVKKSTEMRGILNELEAMASGPDLSAPIRALLGEPPPSPSVSPVPMGRVPATLSAAQESVLKSAASHPLTLAVGPPGTGKSFTIAALALETLSKGGSVLIASRMDHAVDVVGEKIESAIGLQGVVTRGGRRHYLRQLKGFIEELLAGLHTPAESGPDPVKQLDLELARLESRIEKLAARLRRQLAGEARWGALLSDPNPGWFRRMRLSWLRQKLEKHPPVWTLARSLEEAIDDRQAKTVDYLQASRTHFLRRSLTRHRTQLQDFSRAIRARTGHRQAEYFKRMGIRNLLGALPVWLVNLSDIHRVLPLEHEAFDLAIIDEATQCDMASALPILQRARRVVVTGDPKQLRHLSFLPRERQQLLAEQFGLDERQRESFDFRDVSLLDLVSQSIRSQDQVIFLDEHFRSQPEIIAFSNQEFYGGKLHVMTTLREPESAPDQCLEVIRIPEGRRHARGHNPAEAEAVLAAVEAIEESQREFDASLVHSIGLLSPFRDQADHLRDAIAAHPRGAIWLDRHQLLVGTAHSFQGEERDLMFLSLALDDDSPSASFRFLEKPDVFNVAITRARLSNRVWHSFDPSRHGSDTLLGRYLAHIAATASRPRSATLAAATPSQRAHDEFSAEVQNWLEKAGAAVKPMHPLAGMKVDLIYRHEGVNRGIDLIGFPGALSDAFPLERVLTFRRAGLPILPLSYSAWRCQRERCQEWLLEAGR